MREDLVKRLRDKSIFFGQIEIFDQTQELLLEAVDAIEAMNHELKSLYKLLGTHPDPRGEKGEAGVECTVLSKMGKTTQWIPVTERLPECDLGAEVGNIEWISCGRVYAGCFGRGGKYRDAYFRTWTDAGEGMDAKGADYWRTVTLPEPPEEETE